MASSHATAPIATEPASNHHIETIIRSVVLNNAESNEERRSFDITLINDDTVTCSARVAHPATAQTVDSLFRAMGDTSTPLRDLETITDELDDLYCSYGAEAELNAIHLAMLSIVEQGISDASDYIQIARATPAPRTADDAPRLQGWKKMQLHCAKEHYHMAARLLGDFVQLDELRDTGIISDARADETLRLIARGKTLFTMWEAAFAAGLFA